MRRFIIATALLFASSLPATTQAENTAPYSGMQTIATTQSFGDFLERLKGAIKKNKMGIVAQASATKGAAKIGKTIAGNHVLMIYRPDFAVRMLEASIAAGIEAPLRLYITEGSDGKATLTYRLPSHTFGVYEVPALDDMAKELDAIFAQIISDATN